MEITIITGIMNTTDEYTTEIEKYSKEAIRELIKNRKRELIKNGFSVTKSKIAIKGKDGAEKVITQDQL